MEKIKSILRFLAIGIFLHISVWIIISLFMGSLPENLFLTFIFLIIFIISPFLTWKFSYKYIKSPNSVNSYFDFINKLVSRYVDISGDFINEGTRKYGNISGYANTKKIRQYLDKDEVYNKIKSFINNYKIVSSDNIARFNDESWMTLLKFTNLNYNWNEKETIIAIASIVEKENYSHMRQSIEETFISPEEIVRAIVLYDIDNKREKNLFQVETLLRERGMPLRSNRASRLYDIQKEKIQLDYFEKSLSKDQAVTDLETGIRQERYRKQIEQLLRHYHLSTDVNDYYIVDSDFSRESRIDQFYKRQISQVLSNTFGGLCCKCGQGMGQLEFDHFWQPKSKGGNFVMRSKLGCYVNNCIPLCRSCNASKGKRGFQEFFTEGETSEIIGKSQSMNQLINELMIDFQDPDFPTKLSGKMQDAAASASTP